MIMNCEAMFRDTACLTWSAGLLAALSLLGCTGKGVGGACGDISACGGDPSGAWEVVSVCEIDAFQAKTTSETSVTSRYAAPQSPALTQPPASSGSSGDWCQGLSFLTPSDGAQSSLLVRLNSEPFEVFLNGANSVIGFLPSTKQISAVLEVDHAFSVHFTPSCLGARGYRRPALP